MLRQLTNKFLHRVRIHGGEFDSSARAMNRAEGSNSLQADLRKFRGSTFERKQMSTTIKRVALVAVAALGLGVVSVAPSTAAINQDSFTLSSATAAQTTAETSTATSAVATLSFLGAQGDSASVTAALVSGPAGNTALPYLALAETASATSSATTVNPNTAVVVSALAGNAITTAKYKVYLGTSATAAPTVAGTYVVRLTPATVGTSGALLASVAQTLTITVTAAPALDTVAASATVILNSGETVSATTDATVTSARTASTSAAAATLTVALKNAAGSAVTAESYTAVVTGPGILGMGASADVATIVAAGRALTAVNGHIIQLFPDGTSGVSTVTISSAAGKVLATKTVTFFGAPATISATVAKTVVGPTSSSTAAVLSVSVKDAAGVNVSGLTSSLGVVSDSTSAVSTLYGVTSTYDATTGLYSVPVTGNAVGSANLKVTTNASSTDTTGITSAAVAVRVGSFVPASLKVTTDKASYSPGEKATITVQLLDDKGLEVVSGETYTAIFATGGIVSSYTLGSGSATITGTDLISYASGGKTFDVYMPVTEGDVKFSWTSGSTAAGSKTGLATANQAVAGSVTVAVSSAGTSAAIDAANEAAQAASDATDAALAAADAADAATTKAQEAVDAVATLSAQVSKMISALRAQLTTLTNLVIKIQKKVRA